MIRGGALALGAILTLGALGRAEAQDMPALGAASVPSLVGALPDLPQNWADLPLQFRLSEEVEYSSNVLNTPTNSPIFHPLASFISISDYGASTKWNVAGDQLFADVDYGFYRYLKDAALNTAHHSLDAGVNWILTSTCNGRLIASESTVPSQPTQQVAVNQLNTLTNMGFNETAKCGVTGNWGFVFNSGTTTSTNTAAIDKINDFRNVFAAAGITYTVAETNTLQLLATVTGTDYTSRGALINQVGLLTKFTEHQVNLSYSRVINPNLSLIGSIGVVGVSNGNFNLGLPSGWEPQYSFSINWSITPKMALSASVARVVTPPTTLVSNLQLSESATVGLSYQLTPKVTLSTSASASRSSGFGGGAIAQTQNTYSFGANAGYTITPFLTGRLSYQYYRVAYAGGLVTPTSLALLTVVYAPY
jgi:hypothetical protein